MIKRGKKYCKLSELKVNVGEAKLLLNQKITKILSVKTYNLLKNKKQKYRQKSVVEKLKYSSAPESKSHAIYSFQLACHPVRKLVQKCYFYVKSLVLFLQLKCLLYLPSVFCLLP